MRFRSMLVLSVWVTQSRSIEMSWFLRALLLETPWSCREEMVKTACRTRLEGDEGSDSATLMMKWARPSLMMGANTFVLDLQTEATGGVGWSGSSFSLSVSSSQ